MSDGWTWLGERIDLKEIATQAVAFLPQAVTAVLVLFAFFVFYRVTRKPMRAVLARAGLHDALIRLIVQSLYRYALLIVAVVMAADQLGINVAAALAGLGIAGVAIGFAAQDSVANVISGILIFLDKPFVVGDWIDVEGQSGSVAEITLRSTRIRTPRNSYVVIPNKTIVNAVLENFSKHGEFRIDVPIGIAYKEDIRGARRVLLDAIRGMEHVRSEPEPEVVVVGLGDSSVNLMVRVWIDDGSLLQSTSAVVVERSKLALDAAGIQIPFPHLQLFVEDVRERVWKGAASIVSGGMR